MRIAYSQRDNVSLLRFLRSYYGDSIVTLTQAERSVDAIASSLVKHGVDVYVQIAPQWQWGRYVEVTCRQIMDQGIKLLSGEGALFRWYGDDYFCGADVGFYLSPWGYSGNSKLAYQAPSPDRSDFLMAQIIRNQVPQWNAAHHNGKFLVLGQLDNDRSRYYRGSTATNNELLSLCISLFGVDNIVYRPHPKDSRICPLPIEIDDSRKPLRGIIHNYRACISANSTGTIEALCAGMPVMCDGYGPWSGIGHVIQKLQANYTEYPYEDYLRPLASLVHVHYLKQFEYGNPIRASLEFYSTYGETAFSFDCMRFSDSPEEWRGNFY